MDATAAPPGRQATKRSAAPGWDRCPTGRMGFFDGRQRTTCYLVVGVIPGPSALTIKKEESDHAQPALDASPRCLAVPPPRGRGPLPPSRRPASVRGPALSG